MTVAVESSVQFWLVPARWGVQAEQPLCLPSLLPLWRRETRTDPPPTRAIIHDAVDENRFSAAVAAIVPQGPDDL